MTLVAKPVIEKQFWILQDGNQKVGNIEACAGGYKVKINNQVAQFKTIKMAARQVDIEFEQPTKRKAKKSHDSEVYGYPATGKVNNPMWDLKLRAPIYTRSNKSKSWYAAGWYRIKKGRHWTVVQDPKLIVIQRYPYQGPYHSEQECDHADACAEIC